MQFHDAVETANTQVVIHDFDGITVVQEIRNPQADALLTREYRQPFVVPGENEI